MRAADWVIVVAYVVWIVYDGLRRSRDTDRVEGYFLANRSLPWWAVGLSVMATQMSAVTLVGTTGQAYATGLRFIQFYFGLPLAIYLLRNYIASLPRDIIESARMDGASHFQIFLGIVLPLSIPALASFAIFQFLWVWNDFLIALVFLCKAPDQIVLTIKLNDLLGSRGESWEILTASAFVSIAVPVAVFFSLQRFFVRGLLSGSVK